MADEVCKTGMWIDMATGAVVTSAPRKGVQLVPPGGEMTPDRVAAVAAANDAAPSKAEPTPKRSTRSKG